jgi:hypothetical protein
MPDLRTWSPSAGSRRYSRPRFITHVMTWGSWRYIRNSSFRPDITILFYVYRFDWQFRSLLLRKLKLSMWRQDMFGRSFMDVGATVLEELPPFTWRDNRRFREFWSRFKRCLLFSSQAFREDTLARPLWLERKCVHTRNTFPSLEC